MIINWNGPKVGNEYVGSGYARGWVSETSVVTVSRDHLCYGLRVRPAINAECVLTPAVDYGLSVMPAVKAELSVQPAIAYRLVVRPALNGTLRINPC